MNPAGDSAVLTSPYGIELIAAAYRENLVSTSTESESNSTSLTQTEQKITNTINPSRKETILQQIILRDNLYIPERVIRYNGHAFESNSFVIENSALDDILNTYSDALKPSSPSLTQPAHRAERRAQELKWCFENGMISPLYTILSGRNELNIGIEQFEQFLKCLAGEENEGANVLSIVDNKSLVDAVTQYLYLLRNLLEQSEASEGPLITDVNFGQLKNQRQPDISEKESYSAALYFENLKSIDVSSIKQALEVRNSQHVEYFRDEVMGTISDIRTNDITLDDIESRIEAANKALERVDLAAEGRKVCFVLPILQPNPTLATLSTIGTGATYAYKFYAEKVAYNWAFVSSY